ncbi:MAG: hypothetical protein J0M02_00835 [Planctomycetes bacterium]|nr:hypothetical protein [Planctomycetota bacterium]
MSRQFLITIASLCATSAWAATAGTIVEYTAPSGTPSATPPSPYTDAQFLYQYFVPKADDPQQTPLYYRLYVPPSYATSGSIKHPLVIFLHGDGETEQTNPPRNQKQLTNNGQYAFCSTANQAQFPCFFAMVQTAWWGRDTGTKTGSDMATALAAKYRIDVDRIIVTGLSGGGGATQCWVGNQPGTYAGFVALSAPTPQAAGSFKPAGLAKVPSWLFGSEGDSIDCNNYLAATLQSYGAYTMNTRYANGGHSSSTWIAAYNTPALVPWLATLRRGQVATHPVEVAITAPTQADVYATSATTIKPAGTTLDRQYGGVASGITAVNWSIKGGSSLTTTGGTASWSASAAGSLPSGDGYVSATATCGSWNSSRGGVTYVSDVLRIQRSATNTNPTITAIANQSLPVGGKTSALAFTVADTETAAASLTVTATSSNSALVPAGGIVIGGSGNNRTITIIPATGASGSASITVTVSDGTLTASQTFTVTVAANTAPTITSIANQSLAAGGKTGALAFTVADTETAAASLTVTAASSNTALVPAGGIVIGGSGSSRTISVTPATGSSGSTVIKVTVSDGSLTASQTFTVTVASNTAPTITAIANQILAAGTKTAAIPFTVADTETAATSLVVTTTSSNIALVPLSGITLGGSGNSRTITISPASGVYGTSVISITVSDGALSTSKSFSVTVAAPAAAINVDFGSPDTPTSGNFNNITDPVAGKISSAVNADGALTSVGIAVSSRFEYLGTSGASTSGFFPATAQSDFFYVASGSIAVVKLTNLDAAKTYDIEILASRNATDNRTTNFTIGGTTKSINAAGNTSTLVKFTAIPPTSNAISISIAAGTGSSYGYINALRIKEYTPSAVATSASASNGDTASSQGDDNSTDKKGSCGAGSVAGFLVAAMALGLVRRQRRS